MVDIEEIKKILPHGHGFLLIDKIAALDLGKQIVAIKNVTYSEPCFASHFPNHSVFPGMLMLEAGFQAAMVMWYKSFFEEQYPLDGDFSAIAFASKVKEAAFKQMVVPGDTLRIVVEHVSSKMDFYFARASFLVEDGRQQTEVANSFFSGYFKSA